MKTPVKIGIYVVGLVVFFGAAAWLGGRFDLGSNDPVNGEHGHTADDHADDHAATPPGGLGISDGGYRLALDSAVWDPGQSGDFGFTIIGPDGEPVTAFTTQHEKDLHLIVVRRDLTGYQHLHPELDDSGHWHTDLTLTEAGQYRVFADFTPEAEDTGITLGADLAVAGEYAPESLPAPGPIDTVDDYTVEVSADPAAGRSTTITLSVSLDGEAVTDLERYLGASGHLVALRDGDLAYLHVHPDDSEESGPQVSFSTAFPSAGSYRLYFDFQHGDTVRTAEFTVAVPDSGGH